MRHMIRLAIIISCITSSVAAGWAASAHGTLKAKIDYTGSTVVDGKHKAYLLLFDANPFTASSLVDSTGEATPPAAAAGVSHILRRISASDKNATISVTDVPVSPVYVAAFIDASGAYDGHSGPFAGSPMTVYGKALDKAEPINLEEGKPTEIVITFGDSFRVP